MLQFAREAAGKSRAQLAGDVSTSASFITACEKQRKKPSAELRIALASTLGVRPRFFSGTSESDWRVESCYFRHRQAATTSEKGQLRSQLYLYSKILDALAQIVQFPRVNLLDAPGMNLPTESLAQELRRLWRMSADSPVGAICRLIERAGIVILYHSSGSVKVDACSKFGKIPLILISKTNRGTSRLTFDLVHELGELIYRSTLQDGLAREKQINSFVGHFLMPRKGFESHFLSKPLTMSHLLELKVTWRVSMSAILRHSLTLNLLDEKSYIVWKRKLNARGWSKTEPQEPSFSEPEAFSDATSLVISRGLTLSELAEHVDLEEKTAHLLFKANSVIYPEIVNTSASHRRTPTLSRKFPTQALRLVQPPLL